MTGGAVRRWPLAVIAAPAAVAVWSGWVGLGAMCGFGIVHPLPGILDRFQLNTAITLPVGVEAYGAYALGAWLAPAPVPPAARAFARRSAVGALALGMLGQVVYHLLAAAHATRAPWPVVVLVSCLPVVTLGFGAALTHLLRGPAAAAVTGQEPATTRPSQPDMTAPVTGGQDPAMTARPAAIRPGHDRPAATRRKRPPGDRGRRSAADTEAAALAVLSSQPGISGAELGRAVGVSERTGRRLLAQLGQRQGGQHAA